MGATEFLGGVQVRVRGVQILDLASFPLWHGLRRLGGLLQITSLFGEFVTCVLPAVARRSLWVIPRVFACRNCALLRSLWVPARIVPPDIVIFEFHVWWQGPVLQHLLFILDTSLIEVPCQPLLIALCALAPEEETRRAHRILFVQPLNQSTRSDATKSMLLAASVDRPHLRRHVVLLTACDLEDRPVQHQLWFHTVLAASSSPLRRAVLLLLLDALEKRINWWMRRAWLLQLCIPHLDVGVVRVRDFRRCYRRRRALLLLGHLVPEGYVTLSLLCFGSCHFSRLLNF